LKISTKRSRDF